MTATFYVGDAIEVMGKLPEKSVDLVLTSPPFLALRSYLPADHPDKALEGGSQATPGAFIDWLIDVVEACDRVLAPHGSMCIELGDTYAGSGGAGGDYNADGLREGQPKFRQNNLYTSGYSGGVHGLNTKKPDGGIALNAGRGWPLAKSLSLIPELFRFTLVYGFNPLTGRQTERWRLRNVVRWVRPNPPVGALGDKFRPATSELMVFCKSAKRYFDLDAVREPSTWPGATYSLDDAAAGVPRNAPRKRGGFIEGNPAGAPPLDWWNIPPGGYSGTVMWTAKKPVDPRESVGDIWRTTSADCPVHADRPDQAPTAPHDEPVSEDRPGHSPGKGSCLVPGPNGDYVPIDPLLLPNLEDGSSDSTLPLSAPAATPRSKASNKKAPAPATTTPDTASDRTADRTGDTSTGLLTAEPHPDKPANRTSLDGQVEAQPGTSDRIVDTSSEPFDEACTCSYWVAEAQSTSHYAVFPPELCVKPIKAMCPEKVCRVCGEPSRRISEAGSNERIAALIRDGRDALGVDREDLVPLFIGHYKNAESVKAQVSNWELGKNMPSGRDWKILKSRLNIGDDWDHLLPDRDSVDYVTENGQALAVGERRVAYDRGGRPPIEASRIKANRQAPDRFSDCGHDDYRNGMVLDPFAGSGTTLAVATGHGRDAIGIDLDERNYDLALNRVGPFILSKGAA